VERAVVEVSLALGQAEPEFRLQPRNFSTRTNSIVIRLLGPVKFVDPMKISIVIPLFR
jgi:hypothetical protein